MVLKTVVLLSNMLPVGEVPNVQDVWSFNQVRVCAIGRLLFVSHIVESSFMMFHTDHSKARLHMNLSLALLLME